jgi:hypothetical protein
VTIEGDEVYTFDLSLFNTLVPITSIDKLQAIDPKFSLDRIANVDPRVGLSGDLDKIFGLTIDKRYFLYNNNKRG